MILYSFTYLLNSISFYVKKTDNKFFQYIVFFLLVFMSGTRYYMGGNDVLVYEGVYNKVPSVTLVLKYLLTGINEGVNTNYETGFLLLCSVVKAFHFTYFGFILIWTILFYTLMIKGLQEFISDWSVFIAIFMYKIMFYDTFISIRQGLTIALFCFMLRYIRDRKWYIYFPLCILAFLEHNGAIILFPVYFISYMPISKKFIRNYALIFLPTFFISSRVDLSDAIISVAEFIGNTHSSQQWAEAQEKISIIHTLECYIIVCVVLIFYEKITSSKNKAECELALKLFLLAIPMFTLFRDWIILTREKDYFVLMYGLILGYLVENGTTSIVERSEDGQFDVPIDDGIGNCHFISLSIFILCFIGMLRYIVVFDGGVLMHFKSFLFEDGVHIFDW